MGEVAFIESVHVEYLKREAEQCCDMRSTVKLRANTELSMNWVMQTYSAKRG